jgi:hypothetical protein
MRARIVVAIVVSLWVEGEKEIKNREGLLMYLPKIFALSNNDNLG